MKTAQDLPAALETAEREATIYSLRRPAPVVLTADEAAELMRVDRKSVYEAIRARKLPGVRRVGRAIRIHRETLVKWLAG